MRELERLPGFRNVLVHEYVGLDMDRVIEALERLAPPMIRAQASVESTTASCEVPTTYRTSRRPSIRRA